MAITAMDTVRTSTIAITSLLLISSNVSAGDWQFTPSILLDEVYTDNVSRLESNKQSALVNQLSVDLDAGYASQNLNFSLNSSSTYASYSHDHDIDNDYHSLRSELSYLLWPNGIAFETNASVANVSRNGARNALADLVSADTTQIFTINSGLMYRVNNSDFFFDGSVNYTETQSDDDIGERNGINAVLASSSGSGARSVFWDISGRLQDLSNNGVDREFYNIEVKLGLITDYKLNPFLRYYDEDNQGGFAAQASLESNAYGIGLRWLITPRFYLDLSYNKPIDDGQTDLEGNALDSYADVAIGWQPTIRTKLQAGYSQRFYGDSYRFNFTHKNRRLANTITYNETVQAFTRNNFEQVLLGNYYCPITESTSFDGCYLTNDSNIDLDNFRLVRINDFNLVEDQDYSLNKTLNWSSTLALPRTTFTLSLGGNERESLTTRLKNSNKNASFQANRKLSPNSSVNLSATWTRTKFEGNNNSFRQDDYKQFQLEYQRKLNEELSTKVTLSHLTRKSEQLLFTYDENRLTLSVSKGF
ncbi:TIGR03016 family PEP-CTERM system-associated outer membrane protein [Thalassotalea ganghwensis]